MAVGVVDVGRKRLRAAGLIVNEVFDELASWTNMYIAGQVRYGTPTLLTPETLPKTVVKPGFRAVTSHWRVSAVMTLAVPLHVAVPLLSVAVVGGVVAPNPDAVTVRWVPLAIVFWPGQSYRGGRPHDAKPRPLFVVNAVMTLAVPLQVAEPLLSVAVVGGVVPPDPSAVIVRWVPLAIVFVPVNATVAVAPVTPLKSDRVQVWPAEPEIVPPEV